MKRNAFVPLSLAILVISCSAGKREAAPTENEGVFARADSAEPVDVHGAEQDGDRSGWSAGAPTIYRIVTANLEMQVESHDDSMAALKKLAADHGGFVESSSSHTDDDDRVSGTVVLRIPAQGYDGAIDDILEVGDVVEMQESSQDVSEEYVDLVSRLDNQRKLEKRLLDLLETSTGTLDEVVKVEKELSSVRGEIEKIEGRQRYLDNRISMCSVTIDLYEKGAAPLGELSATGVLGVTVDRMGLILAWSASALMMFMTAVLPWLALVVLIIFSIRLIVRLRRRFVPKPA